MPDSCAGTASVVYLFSLTCLAREIGEETARAVLGAPELARLARMRAPVRAREFLFGRYMLRRLLAQRAQTSPERIRLFEGESGKPEMERADGDLHFNLAHAHDVLAIALSGRGAIGVDVEWQAIDRRDAMAIASAHFHASEVARLGSLEGAARDAEFCRMWTLKEAVVKALGAGLHRPIDDIVVTPPRQCYRIALHDTTPATMLEAWHWEGVAAALHIALAQAPGAAAPMLRTLHAQTFAPGRTLRAEAAAPGDRAPQPAMTTRARDEVIASRRAACGGGLLSSHKIALE